MAEEKTETQEIEIKEDEPMSLVIELKIIPQKKSTNKNRSKSL